MTGTTSGAESAVREQALPGTDRNWRRAISRDFWTSPASATGKYHPPGQTMWVHAIGTWRAARAAWQRIPWDDLRDDPVSRREFLVAAFYHDVGKTIRRADHERAGAEVLASRSGLAAYLVLHHSGRWGPCWSARQRWLLDHGLIDLDTPRHRWLADLLAGCDYIDAYRHRIWHGL